MSESHRPPKKERRSYYRRLLESFSSLHFQAWNERLAVRLRDAAKEIPKQSYVAVYRARVAKEADLGGLFSLPFRFCFPRVLSEDGLMEFRYVKSPADPKGFESGPYGILEPKASHPVVRREEMAACFVPMLAFDAAGRRLGNGKGFYDRFLDGFEGLRIGVAFEWQYSLSPLPTEAHDEKLDLVVTEWETRDFRAPKGGADKAAR